MFIISIVCVCLVAVLILIGLIATIYAVSENTQNFWAICSWIMTTYGISYFVIEFTIGYCKLLLE